MSYYFPIDILPVDVDAYILYLLPIPLRRYLHFSTLIFGSILEAFVSFVQPSSHAFNTLFSLVAFMIRRFGFLKISGSQYEIYV